jgi:murein DD-endopeptidase MepM/ murein hydrolase activator NlpD
MNRLICCFLPLACCLPLRNIWLTSAFGYRTHPVTGRFAFHDGVDLRANRDTVYAVLDGRVSATGFDPRLGIYIRLDHIELQSTYGHLSQLFVIAGDSVQASQPIGITGATGRVTGQHLHFSMTMRGRYFDPLLFFKHILKIRQNEPDPQSRLSGQPVVAGRLP